MDRLLCSLLLGVLMQTSQAQCTYTLVMEDADGDGWGGREVWICVDSEPCLVNTLETGGFADVVFEASEGQTVVLMLMGEGPTDGLSMRLLAMNGGTMYASPPQPVDGVVYGFQVGPSCNVPPLSPNDCVGAAQVTLGLGHVGQFTGTGSTMDLDALNGGCLHSEGNGYWVQLYSTYDGLMEFALNALEPEMDMDFAVWGPLQEPHCPIQVSPLRCSTGMVAGPTGLAFGEIDTWEDGSGNGWVSPMPVSYGESYMLHVRSNGSSYGLFKLTTEVHAWTELREMAVNKPTITPNPASDFVRIEGLAHGAISMFDAHGRAVPMVAAGINGSYSTSHLPDGTYFLRCGESYWRLVVLHP